MLVEFEQLAPNTPNDDPEMRESCIYLKLTRKTEENPEIRDGTGGRVNENFPVLGLQAPQKVNFHFICELLLHLVVIFRKVPLNKQVENTDKEPLRKKNKWLSAVHGNHRGVITKVIKETDEILAKNPLTTKEKSRFNVIYK